MRKLSILMILLLAAGAPAWSGTPDPAPTEPEAAAVAKTQSPAAPNYNLNWYSVNSGGAVSAPSSSYLLGVSAGQTAAGKVVGTNYNLGLGFWFLFGGAEAACLVGMTGDVNTTGTITSADIIFCVNYVFKGGPAPLPCAASGDVDCSGTITSADIIFLVNHVFKGGLAPCDVCTMIPGTWSCP